MWILLISMYMTPIASHGGAALHSIEFETQKSCEVAAERIKNVYAEDMTINMQAVCVRE